MEMFSIIISSFISAALLAMIMIIYYTGTKNEDGLKNEKEN